jgi:two-component system OmpR family response regulator
LAEPRTVLIADPCPASAGTLAEVLAACGHRAQTAGTAAAVLALAAADPPDVLITEAVFPDSDGAALARRVAAGRAPAPRLVLLTGRPGAAPWPGFDVVLTKPADPEVLVRLVAGSARTDVLGPRGHAAAPRVTELDSLQERRMATAEERAAELVAVTCSEGGVPRCVELRGPGLPPVTICHYPNPARVREAAAAVRAFVAAVLREAAGRGPGGPDAPLAT